MLFAPPNSATTPSPSSRAHQVKISAATTHVPTPCTRTALTPRVTYPAATHQEARRCGLYTTQGLRAGPSSDGGVQYCSQRRSEIGRKNLLVTFGNVAGEGS